MMTHGCIVDEKGKTDKGQTCSRRMNSIPPFHTTKFDTGPN